MGQHGSNGDCLLATTVARQVKQDFPDCELTWAVSSKCSSLIRNNPDVDSVWELPMADWAQMEALWVHFEHEAYRLLQAGVFDKLVLSQIYPGNYQNYDGTIRPSILRNYGAPITVDRTPVVELEAEEIERVEAFAKANGLDDADPLILFECSSKSGQSFVTPEFAKQVARAIISERPQARIVLSTHEPVDDADPGLVSGQPLSIRETARLSKRAGLLVGCGAAVTVGTYSTAGAPDLPKIQVLDETKSFFGSFRHDFEYQGLSTACFLETSERAPDALARIALDAIEHGFEAARERHDQPPPLDFQWYLKNLHQFTGAKGKLVDGAQSICTAADRYGPHAQLAAYAGQLHGALTSSPGQVVSEARRRYVDLLGEVAAGRRITLQPTAPR